MPPGMGMASGGRPQWQPNTSTPMNYSSSSPGNYGVCIMLIISHLFFYILRYCGFNVALLLHNVFSSEIFYLVEFWIF